MSFPLGLARGNALPEASLCPSALTSVDLVTLLMLPHALGHDDLCARAGLQGQCAGTRDRVRAANRVSRRSRELVDGGIAHVGARRHVDDQLLVCLGVAHDLQESLSVLHVLEVAAGTECTLPVSIEPSEEVTSRPWRFQAELSELCRGEGEERFPCRELVDMLAQATAENLEEGRDIGHEGYR